MEVSVIRLNNYFVYISILIAFIVGLGSSCSDKPTGEDTSDKTPPTIVSVSPADSATNIAISSNIQITFSELLNSDNFDSTVFSIAPAVAVLITVIDETVVLNPESDFEWETQYTISISTALTDTAGNNLAETYQWSFTTVINPDDIPPVVIDVWPTAGAIGVDVDTKINATFSKPMNLDSLQSAFVVEGVTGTLEYTHPQAVFTPDTLLDFSRTYNVTISTAAIDTFDINLSAPKNWSFLTRVNPKTPIIDWLSPNDSMIIEDTITFSADVFSTIDIDSTEFYVNNNLYVTKIGTASFQLDASLFPIGVGNRIHAKAYADTFIGYSETLTIFHKWELLATDFDPIGGIPQELLKSFYRSSDSILEFRFEFSHQWHDPVNDSVNQLDLAIYFDTDQNPSTGRTTAGGNTLNNIGAEVRAIIGIHGSLALSAYNSNLDPPWDSLGGPELFSGLNLPWDAKVFEVGIRWSDLNNTDDVNLICMNAYFVDTESVVYDWMPNKDNGFLTIKRSNRYVGVSVLAPSAKLRSGYIPVTLPNPFN